MNARDLADQIRYALQAERERAGLVTPHRFFELVVPLIQQALDDSAARKPVTHTRAEKKPLYEALCRAGSLDPDTLTKPMERAVSVALNAIVAVHPGLTVAEITLRGARYRQLHSTWPCTPTAIAKHWGSLQTAQSALSQIDEPADWRSLVRSIFHEMDPASADYMARSDWSNLGHHLKRRIAAHAADAGKLVRFPVVS